MTSETVFFYLITLAATVFAVAMVNTRRLLRAALYLMYVLVLSAGYYVLLGAEFLAGVQVLVYVGGVVVVIIFAIMLVSGVDILEDNPPLWRKIAAAVTSIAFLCLTSYVFLTADFPAAKSGAGDAGLTAALGKSFLDGGPDGYLLPFEIISLLLFVAVIGGVVVARRVPAPGQPFTTGGDRAEEKTWTNPKRQSDPTDSEVKHG
jgi:NADH-quinone oxidoreductase subunit J